MILPLKRILRSRNKAQMRLNAPMPAPKVEETTIVHPAVKGDKGDKGDPGQTVVGPKGDKGDQGPAGIPGSAVRTATLSETAVLSIAAGFRYVTVTGVTGVVPGDVLLAVPTSALPAGYAVHDAVCTVAGSVRITISVPLIALGVTYNVPVKIIKFTVS